jgi:hypothetical protein
MPISKALLQVRQIVARQYAAFQSRFTFSILELLVVADRHVAHDVLFCSSLLRFS